MRSHQFFPPAEPQSLKENIVRKGAVQPRELLPALTPIANSEVITTASNYMSRNLCERQQPPPSTVTDPVPLTPSTKSPLLIDRQVRLQIKRSVLKPTREQDSAIVPA